MSQRPPRHQPPSTERDDAEWNTARDPIDPDSRSIGGTYRPNEQARSRTPTSRGAGTGPGPSLDPMRDPDRRMAERLAPQRQGVRRSAGAGNGRSNDGRRRGLSLVTVVAWIIGVLITVGGGGIAAAFLLSPVDLIRDRLIAEVKARTGRDLVIAGTAGFTIYPSLGVRLTDVSLSAPPGMVAPATIVMKGLDVRLAALPLLSQRVVIERLVLREPVIDARIDARGRQSWRFARLDDGVAGPTRLAQAAPAGGKAEPLPAELEAFVRGSSQTGSTSPRQPATAASTGGTGSLDQISFGDVRVENGTIGYTDERSGVVERVTALNASLSLRSMSTVATLVGDGVVRAERVVFDAKLGSIDKLVRGAATKLDLTVAGGPAKAPFKAAMLGDVTAGATGAGYDGAIKLDATSLAELMRAVGRDVAPNADIGQLSVNGRLRLAGTQAVLSEAAIIVDRTRLAGQVAIDFVQPRPHVTATLETPEVDVPRLTQTARTIAEAPTRAVSAAGAAPTAAAPAPAALPRSIGDLIDDPQVTPVSPKAPVTAPGPAKVRGFTQRAGWSDEPIDLASLGAIDLDARLTIGRILLNAMKIGASTSTIALKNQKLRATVDDVQLYDGRGRGIVEITAGSAALDMGANISFDAVSAGPLLTDAAAVTGIAGRARGTLAIAGRGTTERQLIETLTGRGDVAFADGALVGYNVAGMVRQLSQLKFNGLDRSPTEKTDFSELAASFVIAAGVATTQDIRMTSPMLRLAGAGTVAFPDRSLDLKLKPKLVGTLTGQGGQPGSDINLAGLEIPVRLAGPWEKPVLSPDTAAIGDILADPGKAADVVKRIGEQVKNGRAEDLVRGLLGGGKRSSGGGEGGAQPVKPRQFLEQLFKQ